MSDKFKFIIPGRPEYIPTMRLALGGIASQAGFDVEEIDDIKTAVGEACQLIYCHEMAGYCKEYTLECELEQGRLEIKVINSSDELMEKTNKRCLDCPNEGEIGKLLIRTLMDEVDVCCDSDGRKTITMIKTKK